MRKLKLVALQAFRALGLFGLAAWLTRRRLRILCYHAFAVGDESAFRPKMFMPGPMFEERLAWLRKHRFPILTLDDAVRRLYKGTLPDNAVVITVDDGFRSVRSVALPVLEKYQVPATVYVTTYYAERGNPVFRLAVQYLFWRTSSSRAVLGGIGGLPDGVVVDLNDNESASRVAWKLIDYGERRCNEAQRVDLCRALGRALSVDYSDLAARGLLTLMGATELRDLEARGARVELHTHRHTFPRDSRAVALKEIDDNRKALAQWLDGERTHFCYPSGLWDPCQAAWLADAGVESAVTCLPGLNSARTPRYALRRFLDGANVEGVEFEAAMSGFPVPRSGFVTGA